MVKRDRTGSMLSNLDKMNKENNNIDILDEHIVESLCNSVKTKTYNLPAIVDAVLEVLKEDNYTFKSNILADIIMEHASDDVIRRAKEKIIAKSKK